MSNFIKVGDYNDIVFLNDYNGKLSITLGWENQNGEPKPTMCTRQLGKEKKETRMAVSIPLGDREKAMEVLSFLMDQVSDDSAPF
jgi:hypothetical protein